MPLLDSTVVFVSTLLEDKISVAPEEEIKSEKSESVLSDDVGTG